MNELEDLAWDRAKRKKITYALSLRGKEREDNSGQQQTFQVFDTLANVKVRSQT